MPSWLTLGDSHKAKQIMKKRQAKKIMNNLHRTDLLEFGDGKKIRKMQLAKWDIGRGSLDDKTLVPKI